MSFILLNLFTFIEILSTIYSKSSSEFLKTEPLLIDVLDSQKQMLVSSDDIWDLMRPKILLSLEDENNRMPLTLTSGKRLQLCSSHLPDGGLLLKYE